MWPSGWPTRWRQAEMAKRAAPLDDLSRYGRLAEYNRKRRFDVTPSVVRLKIAKGRAEAELISLA